MPQSLTSSWTVFVLPSSHNDVGWAGTPSEIAEHRAGAILDTVLRIMERDPSYAFAMEAGLYLREYLARRPEQAPLLERYTREGRLEWGATYVQPYEGVLDGESLVRQVSSGRGWMRRELGLEAVGYWNIVAGIVGGLLAAVFGLRDWIAIPRDTRAKHIGLLHGGTMVVVVGLFAVAWWIRSASVNVDADTTVLNFAVTS